jgi:hypothetical protein
MWQAEVSSASPWRAAGRVRNGVRSLSYARRLKASGFSDQQAETLADATKELVTDQMVTKSFLESELDKLAMRLTIRMGTIAALCVGALAAIIKL